MNIGELPKHVSNLLDAWDKVQFPEKKELRWHTKGRYEQKSTYFEKHKELAVLIKNLGGGEYDIQSKAAARNGLMARLKLKKNKEDYNILGHALEIKEEFKSVHDSINNYDDDQLIRIGKFADKYNKLIDHVVTKQISRELGWFKRIFKKEEFEKELKEKRDERMREYELPTDWKKTQKPTQPVISSPLPSEILSSVAGDLQNIALQLEESKKALTLQLNVLQTSLDSKKLGYYDKKLLIEQLHDKVTRAATTNDIAKEVQELSEKFTQIDQKAQEVLTRCQQQKDAILVELDQKMNDGKDLSKYISSNDLDVSVEYEIASVELAKNAVEGVDFTMLDEDASLIDLESTSVDEFELQFSDVLQKARLALDNFDPVEHLKQLKEESTSF